MLHITQPFPSHRDGFTLIIGFYVLMALAVLFSTLMLLSTTVALGWYMLTSNNIHLTGLAMLAVLVAIGGMAGTWMLHCAIGLWDHKPSARGETVILSSLLTAASMLIISALKFSRYDGSTFGISLTLLGIGVMISSALTVWYLARPEMERYFRNTR